jgi:demethylmenaquinone methyltransferase/2-methoxy-6-polyprenyl-1,4-benzoquinol methylase
MAHLTGSERSDYVRAMFSSIARRYDLMNRLMTAGQDVRWRREVIRRTALPAAGNLLDLGAGTGDLAREASRQYPGCRSVAADFTLEMMRVGKSRLDRASLLWSAADALCLPFPQATFDAVVSGFLLRNVSDIQRTLQEQYRVLKPDGRIVCLDTTRPASGYSTPLVRFHLRVVIPNLGRLVTGSREAYTYLPDSTQAFLSAEELADRMAEAGFREIGFQRYMLGTIAIHWGSK